MMTEVESAHETHGSFVSKPTGHPLPPPDHGTPVIALFNSFRQPQNLQPIPAIPPKLGKWDQSAPAQVHTNVFTEVLRKDQQDATKILETPSKDVANNVPNSALTNTNLVPYVILHLAALSGDWDIARNFLQSKPQAVRAKITKGSETALHIAAGAKRTTFVEELVKWMTSNDLELKNDVGNTALHFAAVSGIKRIAEVMVDKNPTLPQIRGIKELTPLHMATLLGHREIVWYLYDKTILMDRDHMGLLVSAITADLYDVALDIIQKNPQIAFAREENGETPLHVMARKPLACYSGSQLGFWQRCKGSLLPHTKAPYGKKLMYMQATQLVKQLWEKILTLNSDSAISDLIRTPSSLLFTAAELGNIDFLIILLRSYPGLIWHVDEQNRSIFHTAVIHRQEKVFNLIYELGGLKELIVSYKDNDNNNMLHLAAKLAPVIRLNDDTGAALKLRRELLWFKEVEKIVQPLYKEMRNSVGKTPQILFTEEHKELLREGEVWMKGTASSCMVVQRSLRLAFIVFAISDAVSLISSAASILSFLSVLTSRYAEGDFLHSLPNRLIVGLATLFISITAMMITFVATVFIVLGSEFHGIKVPIALVAGVPVGFYALLQFPLLADMINHAYISRVSFRPCNHLLH
ncbi:PREDICTED: ankyrin [Prunus dulcis]|uniref:PREDICTED: ankyrin n=2 Tax=Prunus dulcis TaxID=3755 RepID=A0A5E4EWZ7_PRUDU|nr:PREDICTED: ankyrin [Prunus dulcis]